MKPQTYETRNEFGKKLLTRPFVPFTLEELLLVFYG